MIFHRIFNEPDFDRLNNMPRWAGWRRIQEETVAHHSFIVTWFARLIVEEVLPKREDLQLKVTTYAIFHDFDETFTGDILHGVKHNKHNGQKLRTLMKEFCHNKTLEVFSGTSRSEVLIRETMLDEHREDVKGIVKLADWLSMAYYLKREVSMGNAGLQHVLDYCEDNIQLQARRVMGIVEGYGNTSILVDLAQWTSKN